jgi:hypothetical protein
VLQHTGRWIPIKETFNIVKIYLYAIYLLHFDYPNLIVCFYILLSFMCIIWHYLSTDSCSMLSFFHFSAAIAELLDNAIDEVIVKVPKYTKIKI